MGRASTGQSAFDISSRQDIGERVWAAMARHPKERPAQRDGMTRRELLKRSAAASLALPGAAAVLDACAKPGDRKSTRLNSSHVEISYAVFCLKKKKRKKKNHR